ncbi:MAG: hypothetical protein ACTHNS_04395 [Marmoricola sp.]
MSDSGAASARPLLAVLLATLTLLCGGCASSGTPAPTPRPSPTPLARLNTSVMVLPRIDFCTLVPAPAVRRALGGRTGDLARWADGDATTVGAAGRQVVAEHGCAWSAGTAVARAWTFAPPVTPAQARAVVARSRTQQRTQQPGRGQRCRDVDGPAFGRPSLTQVCSQGATRRVRHAGLFGDTWLTCEVADDAATGVVRRRADAWCVEVANTLNLTR